MAIGIKLPSNPTKSIITMVVIALALLYLFGVFFPVDPATGSPAFGIPEDAKFVTNVFVILLLGAAVVAAHGLASTFGKPLGKRDVMTLVFVALLVWFLWDQILQPLFTGTGLGGLNEIAFSTVKKLGLAP